ncbi:magnesium and cobalt transport protein CorA [Actinomycetospora endophytica]|uniref:Magnesium and cobalt transport protein CorA n=1 Tax=Actinomycetospora endophytica TaxID=2291215 RepID=A0ABS8P7Y2_9PSEU|nr:magnesium and cobalt transport protein CorA [Actinomycetospora endophytica]MCD2194343.1 magnesium and cobalt transport protein CorA [Actinomycetospora endophytica]
MPALPSLRSTARGRRPRALDNGVHVPHVPLSAFVVDCAVYVDGKRLEGRWNHRQAIEEVRRREEGFVWVGLHEPDAEQIDDIAEVFGLHPLAVEDAVHAHQRPKIERYDDMLFSVFKTMRYVAHASPTTANEIVESGELMCFVGKDFVVTVRHGQHSGLRRVRRTLEEDPEHLALGPAAVLHAVADHIVDAYLDVSAAVEGDIDTIEAEVFAPHSELGADQIYLMKREVLELRRAVQPLVAPLRRLTEGYSPLVPTDVRSYFRDVDDHLVTVSERVAQFDELLTTLVDAVLAKITLRQNNDMRKITAYAALLAVPTMFAGIYGMNFDYMPELHWTFGYPLVIVVIVAICAWLFRTFRRNHWL